MINKILSNCSQYLKEGKKLEFENKLKILFGEKINHIYNDIEGWFDFEDVYTDMVEKAEENSHFVEVGAWLGKSTSYMAVEIANSNKNIKFDAVDTWEGSDEDGHKNYINGLQTTLYEKFLDNIKSISSYINPIKGFSTEISKTYEDNSLDFVFLDASHDYENVKKDIESWYPKVKSTGYIAGHDYNEEGIEGTEWLGVVKAVNEFFGKDNIKIHKVHAGTWIVKKDEFENRKIQHIYKKIPGFFDFQEVYTMAVNKFDSNSHFVEVGAAWGCSSSYMAVEIANSKKKIKFDVIDHWINDFGKSFYDEFITYISPVKNYINPIIGDSKETASYYKDQTLDFVFIDASHDYENVKKDILSWLPKVKIGGIIAGHDYSGDFPGVIQAVDEIFSGKEIKRILWSWIVEKKEENINTIKYLSGGLLGDFIHQLSVIKENYLKTGKKGDLYITDSSCVPKNFPSDWEKYPCLQTNWRFGMGKAYEDLREIVLNQDYINSFQVYNESVIIDSTYIHLSSWRKSPFLYRDSFYNIFKNEYDVEWGLHKWLDLPTNDNFSNFILISMSSRRHNPHFNFKDLEKYGKKIYFATLNIEEYDEFKKWSNCDFKILLFDNLLDYWIAINSCFLFVSNPSSFSSVARALHKNTITILPNNEEDIHLQMNEIKNLKWYKNENENTLEKQDKILVMSCCYNEIKILPFYLDYYLNFLKVDKILIYDGGSTDGSLEMMRLYPNKIEVVIQKSEKLDDRELNDLRNNAWKKYRENFDWIFICDMDEILYHPDLRNLLISYKEKGISIPLIEGFDMISKVFPKKGDFLPNTIKTGIKEPIFLNKKSIFKSNVDINYHIGSHGCDPTNGVFGDKEEIKLLHYKWLSHEYLTRRSSNVADRLSDWNLSGGCGSHNKPFSKITLEQFNDRFKQSDNVFNSRPTPAYGRGGFVPATNYMLNNLDHNPIIVEIGTQRNFENTGDGSSTSFFAHFINRYGGTLYSIDIERTYIENGRVQLDMMGLMNDNIHLICADGIEFLKNFKDKIDLLYLDGWDYNGSEKDKEVSEQKHLECYLIAKKSLSDNHLILIDDIIDGTTYEDKGRLLIPYLLEKKYNQILNEWQFLFAKKKTKLIVFSHNYLINNWEEILDEQLNLLKSSGLYKNMEWMSLGYYSENVHDSNLFVQKIINFDSDKKMTTIRHDKNFYEYPTIQFLQGFANFENQNFYVLYFHLKGVWSQKGKGNPVAIKSWRKCLEYFTIERWEDCIEKLDEGYEVVGALYNYNEKEPLFSGNFWWTTTNYIKKLPRLEYIRENDPYKDLPDNDMGWCRVECEKWINKIPNKFYNFYIPKDYGFYFIPLEEKDYRKSDLEKYKISVLIPTYNRNEALKEALDSVLKQEYKNLEIIVCHDGPSEEYRKFVLNSMEKYSYVNFIETKERKNNYGAAQRNEMLKIASGDYILHLDDDNILYDGYLKKMTSLLDEETGMVVCRIHFNDKEWKNYVLPIEDKLQPCFIDQLGILFKSDISKFDWDDYFGHDHRYITKCESESNEKNLKIKYIPDILASHRYLGEIKPRITIFHHCYLRYNWKSILENQIKLMKENGLYDECSEIFVTAYAEEQSVFEEFEKIVQREDVLNKWKIIKEEKNDNEFETLKLIKKYSEDKHAFICYFHLKGVISEQISPNIGVPYWRDYLNYFTINKWKSNIEKLKEGNDVVCVDWNFNDMHQRYVLGGHFFWTTSEYIRTLKEPVSDENRFLSEIWITSNENVKVYENFNYEKIGFKNLYLEEFPSSFYRTDMNIKIFQPAPEKFKEVVVMTSHPNYSGIENITMEAIKSFKDKGKDVILCSHTPLSIELQKAADYVVYDKNNPLIRHDFFTQSWFNTEDYHALIQLKYNDNNFNHALGVYLNYYNGFMLAKKLGYNTAICSNFDLIFHPEDIDLIDNKIKEMYSNNKMAFFMNTPEKEGIHYKTIFFMTNIEWYLNKFEYITDGDIYNEEIKKCGSETNCLENFIYHSLKNYTNEILLQEIDENTLFSKSRINMFSLIEYQTILPDQGCPHCFVVWFSSSNRVDDRKLDILVKKNEYILETISENITNEYRFYKKFRFEDGDDYKITFVVKNSLGEILKNKTIEVNDDIFKDIKSYGNFIFKR